MLLIFIKIYGIIKAVKFEGGHAMLQEFRVTNFKGFKDELKISFDKPKNYEFNEKAIKDSTVKTCLIYGINGSGKSNLGLALLDISISLTDKEKNLNLYNSYTNFENQQKYAKFYYRFKFNGSILEYSYEKINVQTLLKESLKINGKEVIKYDHLENQGLITLEGAQNLDTNLNGKPISFVKYIKNNTSLKENSENEILGQFYLFVDHMLLFSSLEKNQYMGYRLGTESIATGIIEAGKIKDFEKFLKECEIRYNLIEKEVDGEKCIYCKFPSGLEANFYSIASTGTRSLALYYYWSIYLLKKDEISFVFIDEFDAFYHNEVAETVVKSVLESSAQAVITTHNTSIMSNQLLRPDCYFNFIDGNIQSLDQSTKKELRQAHNIEKMYKAGSFNEK